MYAAIATSIMHPERLAERALDLGETLRDVDCFLEMPRRHRETWWGQARTGAVARADAGSLGSKFMDNPG